MEVTNIVCDVCGMPKGETNHWLDCITVPMIQTDPGMTGIAFAPLGTPLTDPSIKKEHICGQACAQKRLSQFLETL